MSTNESGKPVITARPNGSLRVEGLEVLLDAEGRPIRTEGRGKGNVALCRCGQSGIKPFCDGTHKKIGFRSARSTPGGWGPGEGKPPAPGPPRIEVIAHGPYIVSGGIELIDEEHGGRTSQPRYALCRCGHSANKPFCDASHRTVGFNDPGLDTTVAEGLQRDDEQAAGDAGAPRG